MEHLITNVKPLFKRNAEGLAIPELSDPSLSWVINGNGWASYKLEGILCRVFKVNNEFFCRKWDKDKKRFEIFDPKTHYGLNKAWEDLEEGDLSEGYFVAYGKDIKGNPHGCTRNEMIRVALVDSRLLIPHGAGLRPFHVKSIQGLFDIFKAELSAPETDCSGIVFHKEESSKLADCCQVTREEFGLGKLERKPLVLGPATSVNNSVPDVGGPAIPGLPKRYHKCGICENTSCDCVMLQCTGKDCFVCDNTMWGV